tara:strand:- start:1270 stop:1923 length:654 start_codon:yes stop_codon:yes gene_type:complete
MKNRLQIITVLMCVIFSISFAQTENSVSFRYGFIGKKAAKQDSLYIIENESPLKSGDLIKLNIEFTKGNYAYVVYLSSQNEYLLLYSSILQDSKSRRNRVFSTLPWMELDERTGLESFYFMVSDEQLVDFEKLLENYTRAKKKTKMKFHRRVQAAIEHLLAGKVGEKSQSQVKRLKKPVIGGVTFRGSPMDVITERSLMYESTGKGVASSVFLISHE